MLPVLLGAEQPHSRLLFWRYKANAQRAVRSGDFKYLKIAGTEFLFNLAEDQRERANLAEKYPDRFKELKQQWDAWNATMLPVTDEVRTYKIDAKVQADHYHQIGY